VQKWGCNFSGRPCSHKCAHTHTHTRTNTHTHMHTHAHSNSGRRSNQRTGSKKCETPEILGQFFKASAKFNARAIQCIRTLLRFLNARFLFSDIFCDINTDGGAKNKVGPVSKSAKQGGAVLSMFD